MSNVKQGIGCQVIIGEQVGTDNNKIDSGEISISVALFYCMS